jgi:predicted metal-dependent enzyme (double-stranded beta helix superfamily)
MDLGLKGRVASQPIRILEVMGARVLKEGEVAISWPPDNDIHKVENPSSNMTTVEIHVYGMDLGKLRTRSLSV